MTKVWGWRPNLWFLGIRDGEDKGMCPTTKKERCGKASGWWSQLGIQPFVSYRL